MLLIPTYIKNSQIDGIGLFAAGDIPKNIIVWKHTLPFDTVYYQKTLDKVPPFSDIRMYSFEVVSSLKFHPNYYILCGDNARFINHSEIGNLTFNLKDLTLVAARDIKQDEELTENYLESCEKCKVFGINAKL